MFLQHIIDVGITVQALSHGNGIQCAHQVGWCQAPKFFDVSCHLRGLPFGGWLAGCQLRHKYVRILNLDCRRDAPLRPVLYALGAAFWQIQKRGNLSYPTQTLNNGSVSFFSHAALHTMFNKQVKWCVTTWRVFF